jgi:hypothetical protein
MTARADRLTKRARTPHQVVSLRSSYPASSLRVFVDALERLDYCMEPLLANAGIRRADLDDPDARSGDGTGRHHRRSASVNAPSERTSAEVKTPTRDIRRPSGRDSV